MRLFFKLAESNVVMVGHPTTPAHRVSRILLRLSIARPWLPLHARTSALEIIQRMMPLMIAGTVAKGRKGWRIYISAPAMLSGDMTFSQLVAHERFHTRPIIGLSEIAAHFIGGLHRRPGKLSWKYALHDVLLLRYQRPRRFFAEMAMMVLMIAALMLW